MNMPTMTRGQGMPTQPLREQTSLGSFTTYAEAQGVVDYLADHQFEVDTTQIVGTDLRMIEQITGRLTWPRAILSGVASGVWFGIFVGLVINILTDTTFLRAMSFGIVWGVLFFGVFAAIGYGMTAGRRDFTSRSAIIPSRFDVLVEVGHSGHAQTVLAAIPR